MKICIEVELVAEYRESDSAVKLEGLRFLNCTQNVLYFLSPEEQTQAQQALEEAVQNAAIERVQRLLERKQMRGDHMREIAREFQQEALREGITQRGSQLA